MRYHVRQLIFFHSLRADIVLLFSCRIVTGNAQGIEVNKDKFVQTELFIDQVRSYNNVGSTSVTEYGNGFRLYGEEITVKDSEASWNDQRGLIINGNGSGTTNVDLKGTNYFRHNGKNGLVLSGDASSSLKGTLTVYGKVNIYGNPAGFRLAKTAEIAVEVKKGGSLLSCNNPNTDIRNDNDSTTFAGNGYTCDNTFPASGKPLPVCDPCPLCN